MKPKFALDLSHEGINLLHRSSGGWTLVGSVALDDTDMGRHLAELRRSAAELESGGFTTKIIIPNSQILYTTMEAPGPDDIAREVQIRSGLDGLTPYPVGDLVFDWRAAGERARVAVLSRDTMDEAETFAVEHRFNPVSFVARPMNGEFSGEPFFGKTRAATKILGPTERVEPDASPVPRRPRAVDQRPTAPLASARGSVPPAFGGHQFPASDEDPSRPTNAPADAPDPLGQQSAPGPVPEPQDAPLPDVGPSDDQFAELDAIQAELSGDPDAAVPAFRSRARSNRARFQRADSKSDQPAAPPLAPFPPTSDEAQKAAATAPARKPRATGKAAPTPPTAAESTRASAPTRKPAPPAPSWTPPEISRPAALDGSHGEAAPAAGDSPDTPDTHGQQDAPDVAFSTRRANNSAKTSAPPSGRDSHRSDAASTPPPAAPTTPAATPPASETHKAASVSDRRRADMADALSRPMPGSNARPGPDKPGPDKPEPDKPGPDSEPRDPNTDTTRTGAVRSAASGLRSFGQRRTARKDEAKPTDSSMTELMRGAGSSEGRISPSQRTGEPDLLDPRVAPTDGARAKLPVRPSSGETPSSPAKPASAPHTGKTPSPAVPPTAKPVAKPTATPTPAIAPATAPSGRKAQTITPTGDSFGKSERTKASTAETETLSVFGARRAEEKRGLRKYLGVILTLLLLLVMAIIALWSMFFVDDGPSGLFNPADAPAPISEVAPETQDNTVSAVTDPDAVVPDPATGNTQIDPDGSEGVTPVEPDAAPTPTVLSLDEAEAQYAATQIWQKAPDSQAEPHTPGLDIGEIAGPGTGRGNIAEPAALTEPDATDLQPPAIQRAAPLPPPPADTVFELDDSGLVAPSRDGTVSPTGVVVFEGPPSVVPPAKPEAPARATPDPATPDPATPDPATSDAAAANPEATAPDTPETPPAALDTVSPDAPTPDATTPDPISPDARLETAPEDGPSGATAATDTAAFDPDASETSDAPATETPASDAAAPSDPADQVVSTAAADAAAAAIEAAVDAAASNFVDPSDLAVSASLKPTQRPDDIDRIVNAARARAAAAPEPEAPAGPALTTPAIPTSASVADQATTEGAINLREINLLGISGPTNARRALVRMGPQRYVIVKVGDRLDGGRVTSITSDGLTYQKGTRNLTLHLLPLG